MRVHSCTSAPEPACRRGRSWLRTRYCTYVAVVAMCSGPAAAATLLPAPSQISQERYERAAFLSGMGLDQRRGVRSQRMAAGGDERHEGEAAIEERVPELKVGTETGIQLAENRGLWMIRMTSLFVVPSHHNRQPARRQQKQKRAQMEKKVSQPPQCPSKRSSPTLTAAAPPDPPDLAHHHSASTIVAWCIKHRPHVALSRPAATLTGLKHHLIKHRPAPS